MHALFPPLLIQQTDDDEFELWSSLPGADGIEPDSDFLCANWEGRLEISAAAAGALAERLGAELQLLKTDEVTP